MNRRTRPARTPLTLGLAALALLHVCAFAPRLHASQTGATPAQTPAGFEVGDPITKEWLLDALRARRLGEEEIVGLVGRRGSSYFPTAGDEKELTAAGATARLLEAVRKSYRGAPWVAPRPSLGGLVGDGGGPGPGAGPVDYTRPFRQSEVTKRALITFKPGPGFTEEARKNDVEGVVRLRAVLAASGQVVSISVVKGLPDGLTEKAVAAARRIRFTPAQKDGRPVSQYVVLEYNFIITVDEDDVDERAVILEKPPAEYTEEARRHNTRGKVRLRVTLTSFGPATVESVEEELPHGLTQKAVEAAQRIKFKPARIGGRPVSQNVTVEYIFAP